MGVRGLTTFIAKQANKYFENYQLHDSYLVIDGNNIASQLYKWHCTRNDCFGGDYDKYAKVVYGFFKLLEKCNVTPLVVFDGSYEDKKLRTVYSRLRDKVKAAKQLNSVTQRSISLFPLFMRDLFVEIVLQLGLKTVRCDFEADQEMACLARVLKCPVLSYDSDFYVFDVLYIPFSTFDLNARKIRNSSPPRFFISCNLYRIENFIKQYGGLNKSNLPLIAVLLGNDYIKKSIFQNFYSHIKLPRRRNISSDQQRKIMSVIKWMQKETYDSAVRKILGRLKGEDRKHVAEQIKLITEGYICTSSKLLQYLDVNVQNTCDVNVQNTCDVNVQNTCDLNVEINLNDADFECEHSEDGDDEDVESCIDSDDSECSLELSELQSEASGVDIPDWFMNKYHKCEYPTSFMDILLRNTYFCTPQLEDYANSCSHLISIGILSAIHKILLSGTVESLKYVARNEKSGVRNYPTPPCSLELPTLASLKDIGSETAKDLLLQILDITSESVTQFMDSLPTSWRLYVLAIIYWIRNAKPKVAYCHVYAVALCMLVLNKIDEEVGYYRSTIKFMAKFEHNLKEFEAQPDENKSSGSSSADFRTLLSTLSGKDCLLCCKELIPYFQMEKKMASHPKLFDVHIVDCFAQFQSCLLHVKYLNKLLNKPFVDFLISEFYDGTFLYNMCNNLMSRGDVNVYTSLLLKNSPSVSSCFKALIGIFVKIMAGDIITTAGKKKRRKKKNKTPSVISTNDVTYEDSSEEELVDANNRFSLLRLAI